MFVDAAHERITTGVLAWMCSQRLFGDPHDCEAHYREQALVAATFAYLCSAAEVGEPEYFRAAQFTSIFLYFDDVGVEPANHEHPAVRAWLSELEGIAAGRSALADFRASFADYRASLVEERQLGSLALAREDYFRLRRRTVFVEPYLDHWRVLAGIDIDGPARATLHRGQGLARDLIMLANDLGSLVRDTTTEQREMNLIVQDAQRLGSLAAAVEQGVAQYHELLAELRELVSVTLSGPERASQALARLLVRAVDGNLATMRLLTGRYAHATVLLDRLLPCAGG